MPSIVRCEGVFRVRGAEVETVADWTEEEVWYAEAEAVVTDADANARTGWPMLVLDDCIVVVVDELDDAAAGEGLGLELKLGTCCVAIDAVAMDNRDRTRSSGYVEPEE